MLRAAIPNNNNGYASHPQSDGETHTRNQGQSQSQSDDESKIPKTVLMKRAMLYIRRMKPGSMISLLAFVVGFLGLIGVYGRIYLAKRSRIGYTITTHLNHNHGGDAHTYSGNSRHDQEQHPHPSTSAETNTDPKGKNARGTLNAPTAEQASLMTSSSSSSPSSASASASLSPTIVSPKSFNTSKTTSLLTNLKLPKSYYYFSIGTARGDDVDRFLVTSDIIDMIRDTDAQFNFTDGRGETLPYWTTPELFQIIMMERSVLHTRDLYAKQQALEPLTKRGGMNQLRFFPQATMGFFRGARYKQVTSAEPVFDKDFPGDQRIEVECNTLLDPFWSLCNGPEMLSYSSMPLSVSRSSPRTTISNNFFLLDIDSVLQSETVEGAVVYISANVTSWEAMEWVSALRQSHLVMSRVKYLDLRIYDWYWYPDEYTQVVKAWMNLETSWKAFAVAGEFEMPVVAISKDGYPPINSPKSILKEKWEPGSSPFLFAVLAGNATFERRIGAQANTWMRDAEGHVIVTTNVEKTEHEINSVFRTNFKHPVHLVRPLHPELEPRLEKMQSWSHLVRVREAWDHYMKTNRDLEFLALVDDDTFVFRSGLEEVVRTWKKDTPTWGGSLELPRVDNEDKGRYGFDLRNWFFEAAGAWCAMPGEDLKVTEELLKKLHNQTLTVWERDREIKISTYKKTWKKGMRHVPVDERGWDELYPIPSVFPTLPKVGQNLTLCSAMFCRRGCPPIVQGGSIVLNRKLVELLRPHIETCELETNMLCERCGSQRLYFCIVFKLGKITANWIKGSRRYPWRKELATDNNQIQLSSMHGFDMEKRFWSKGIDIDFDNLWHLTLRAKKRAIYKSKAPSVMLKETADFLGCKDAGTFVPKEKRAFICIPKY